MAQGTSGDIDTRQFVGDVTAQIGAVLIVRQELFDREEAPLGEDGIEAGSSVAFAEDEAVTRRRPGIDGVDVQNAAIESREDVGAGENRADVSATAFVGHAQHVYADGFGETPRIDGSRMVVAGSFGHLP